jgi:hypothetical protein
MASTPNTLALVPGDHVVTPRWGYLHHGIYAGAGRVIHYAGLSKLLPFGSVEEVSLGRFAGTYGVAVAQAPVPRFSADEVIRRARSRIGESRYSVLTNNCEHFCAWCLSGSTSSAQVERWRARLGGLTTVFEWIVVRRARHFTAVE